jgi:23S rRNA (adenine-N6)-dimethyltransferase
VHRGELVLDVGAGTGALTRPLVATGARVIAVELHPKRAAQLRERFADDRVTVVRADAADLRLPRRPFRVVANPPFAIVASLLRRLLHPGSLLERADLVVPTHVAERWAAGAVRGAARWDGTFTLQLGQELPRRAFRPATPAPAAVLTISRRARPGRSRGRRPPRS